MNKYPYIGKGRSSGSIVLIYSNSAGVTMEAKSWATKLGENHEDVDEDYFTNITTEYLANTYGKVESPEHAEFIVEFCEVNGIEVSRTCKGDAKTFMIDSCDGLHFFPVSADKLESTGDYRQITIPMPTKSELKEAGHNLVFAGEEIKWKPQAGKKAMTYDGSVCTVKFIEGDLAWCKFDENKIMIKVHVNNLKEFKEEGKMKDWPQVGDEVSFPTGEGVIVLDKPDDQGVIVVECSDDELGLIYKRVSIKALSKPKTEVEILRDELTKDIDELIRIDSSTNAIAEMLIDKYNITKKGE